MPLATVVVLVFAVTGADAAIGEQVALRIADDLRRQDYAVTIAPLCLDDACLYDRGAGATFVVHGAVDAATSPVMIDVRVALVEGRRAFGRRSAAVTSTQDAAVAASDAALAIVQDPFGGMSVPIFTGALIVLGGGAVAAAGIGGLAWVDAVRGDPAAPAATIAQASAVEVPLVLVVGAAALGVLVGAVAIIAGASCAEP